MIVVRHGRDEAPNYGLRVCCNGLCNGCKPISTCGYRGWHYGITALRLFSDTNAYMCVCMRNIGGMINMRFVISRSYCINTR